MWQSGRNIIIGTLLEGRYKRESGLDNKVLNITTKEGEKVLAQYNLGLLGKQTH